MFRNCNFESVEYLPPAVMRESNINKDTSTMYCSSNIFLLCRRNLGKKRKKELVHRTSKLYLGQANYIKRSCTLCYFQEIVREFVTKNGQPKASNPHKAAFTIVIRDVLASKKLSTDYPNLLLLGSIIVVVMNRIRAFPTEHLEWLYAKRVIN